ncbi:hypothetical protein T10_8221 [Trichinella papuae]|uniref:Uncharacterized protein n=1 Tax=Trichinella papuae TaxID=268474 RepID=A0A0V1MQC4_9BILA|nr:hypothetical protein T10_8221 [Trichinella papuae]
MPLYIPFSTNRDASAYLLVYTVLLFFYTYYYYYYCCCAVCGRCRRRILKKKYRHYCDAMYACGYAICSMEVEFLKRYSNFTAVQN